MQRQSIYSSGIATNYINDVHDVANIGRTKTIGFSARRLHNLAKSGDDVRFLAEICPPSKFSNYFHQCFRTSFKFQTINVIMHVRLH